MKNRKIHQVRDIFCVLYLALLTIFEVYSAVATALDHSGRFPGWEAKLGWWLLILPSMLAVGLSFLLRRSREVIGFSLAGLSVLLYLGFLLLDMSLSPERVVRTDGASIGIWISICCVAITAAWALKSKVRSEPGE